MDVPWLTRPALVPVRALELALGISRTKSYELTKDLEPVRIGKQLRLRVEVIRRRYGDDVAEAVMRACQEAA